MGKHNITCDMVAPGLTDIASISLSTHSSEYQKAFTAQVPLGRLATPDEIANAELFIAWDPARFISRQLPCVDGGYSAGKFAVVGPHIAAYYGMVDPE
jgi:NAD(P)-dependent dehydrogenase (short-subunit alcohol dehydrogenase family)